MAGQTLSARFLPFVMDRNDPNFEAIAIQCAEQCLSWARAIQQYASLNIDSGVMEMNVPPPPNGSSHNVQLGSIEMATPDEEVDSDNDLLLSEQEERQSHGEDLMSSMGL